MIEGSKEPTILVPIDYSPQSMAAYDYSKILARIPDPELNLNIKHHLFKEIVDPLQVFGKLDT